MIDRRRVLLGSAAVLGGARPLQAQGAFPQSTLTFVVASAAGGGSDILSRLVAERMQKDIGQTIVVENRPGAAGNIGAAYVARAPKDGYTILLTAGALAIAPSVYERLSYNPITDLAGVAWLATVPLIMVTKNNSEIGSIKELLEKGRRADANLTFGSFGTASPPHLVGESINQSAGTKLRHVPYNRGGAATDTMTGILSIAILDAVSTMPLIQAGELRALAVTGPRRLQILPDVPTLTEAGIPFDTVGWHAAFVPAGTPASIIERLNAGFVKALAQPGMADRLITGGSVPIDPPATPAQWDAQFRKDVESWAKVARAANISIK